MRKQKRKFGYNLKSDFDALTMNGMTVIFPNKLKAKYQLTNQEINLLSRLVIFKDYEYLPVRVNGVKNGEKVFAPPISVAVFDYYYGTEIQMQADAKIFSVFGFTTINHLDAEIETKRDLAKSIFKKVSPNLYSRCF